MPQENYDVVVLGGGTAGVTAALSAAHEGARVALVERTAHLGGDCTYTGGPNSLSRALRVAD